jgi:hypothetical protein
MALRWSGRLNVSLPTPFADLARTWCSISQL